ncbi:hypothetical protein GCM10025867_22360 [Frondihabitans sucicola]|uniref:Uncharacterized protein n=1 Tax=Frondihabitans sucicola TaxID=1268041 RepID=A0ABM8GNH5_9MICO|nr:hypothetical protein GCM10025867_22360 [Frondihabitans sucicola]
MAGLAAASSLALIVGAVALPASAAEAAARAAVSPAAVGPVASSPAAAGQAAAVTPPAAPAGSCPVYGSPGSGEIAGTDANVSVYVGGDYAATAGAAESEESSPSGRTPGSTSVRVARSTWVWSVSVRR